MSFFQNPKAPVALRDAAALFKEDAPENRSTTQAVPNTVPFHDVLPTHNSEISDLFRIEESLYGIGLHGQLPPGFVMLGTLSDVADVRDLGPIYTDPTWAVLRPLPSPNTFVLYPGQTVTFGRRVKGLDCRWLNPWKTDLEVLPKLVDGSTLHTHTGGYGPTTRPLLRVFSEEGAIPNALPYQRVPSFSEASISADAPTFNTINTSPNSDVSCRIPLGTKYVTLAFFRENGTSGYGSFNARDQLATTIDVGVYWIMPHGLYVTQPSDQCTAAGRGQISNTHSVEVFQVPNAAIALYLHCAAVASERCFAFFSAEE